MCFQTREIIPRHKAFQYPEATTVISHHPAKVLITTQPVRIQVKRLLNSASKQSLLDQQLVLIQDRRVTRRRLWPCFEAGSQSRADGFVNGFRLRQQEIPEKIAEEGVRGVDNLPIDFIAKHQAERLEPLQVLHQLAIRKADERPGNLSPTLNDPEENLHLHAAGKQRQSGEKVALSGGEGLGVLFQAKGRASCRER